ncbi:MAG: rhodanese-like domain-containing protein [Dehalococcoidales bacterium]|jgi:hypothetical protein
MKGRILGSLLIILVLLSAGCTRPTATSGIPTAPSPQALAEQGFVNPNLPRITSEELKQKMDQGDPLVVVAVDEKDLFDRGHLPGALNIPSYNHSQLQALPKDRLIVFYCA